MFIIDDSWFPYWTGDIHLSHLGKVDIEIEGILKAYHENGSPKITLISSADQLVHFEND